MSALEPLRQSIDQQQDRLRLGIPAAPRVAVLALLDLRDRPAQSPGPERQSDLVTGSRLDGLGWNMALRLCLESTAGDTTAPGAVPSGWAERFLEECDRLAEAELVLGHCETGFMQLAENGDGTFDAWIATKRPPAGWRERADFDWWAAALARRHAPEIEALREAGSADCLRLARLYLETMACQLGYPPDALIDGCTVRTYREVLARLLAWALEARDAGDAAAPRPERALTGALATALRIDSAAAARALSAFTLDRENAAYHAAPGVAAAPLIRVAPDQLVWSLRGLTGEPLLFLARELRHRAAEEYHNSAHLREDVFRQDLYALFEDKRFVTSAGKIELRREGGEVRTDIDAVVFDRKSGTLAVFELKSQDPFARSTAELARQRDNVLYANRQVSGVLAWLNRHGADALLQRVDPRTARTFRAQKVYPFVLGRYIAHFSDGPEPDRRAAWGTWPQVLRLLDGRPLRVTDANPIASLFNRLAKDIPLVQPPTAAAPQEIPLGPVQLTVHPSYAAFRAAGQATDRRR